MGWECPELGEDERERLLASVPEPTQFAIRHLRECGARSLGTATGQAVEVLLDQLADLMWLLEQRDGARDAVARAREFLAQNGVVLGSIELGSDEVELVTKAGVQRALDGPGAE